MTENDIEVFCKTIYGEARGETQEGQIAVACCILNRFKSKKWFSAKTIAGVCQKPWQFSCWNKSDPNAQKLARLSKSEWMKYKSIIDIALISDITGGATHYYAPALVKCPAWAEGKIPCSEYGHHLFFKDID